LNLEYYKQAILNHFKDIETTNMILAGGALTSMFSGKEINDLDLYPKNKKAVGLFLDQGNVYIQAVTDKALSCSIKTGRYDSKTIQVIYFDYFEHPEDIFKSFDFTINMAAFDFDEEEFIFHPDFFKDLASKSLVFNPGTAFPLISGMRVNKYLSRGYSISKAEHRKLLMAVSKLDLSNKESFMRHLGGMYSMQAMVQVMLWPEGEPFDQDKALEKIQDFVQTEPKLFFGKGQVDSFEQENIYSCSAAWLASWFFEDEEHKSRLKEFYWLEVKGEVRTVTSLKLDVPEEIELYTIGDKGRKERLTETTAKSMVHMLFYPEQYDSNMKLLHEMVTAGGVINGLIQQKQIDTPF